MPITSPAPTVPGDIPSVEPDVEHAGRPHDDSGEEIGGDAMKRDVVTHRAHASRIVADRHQRAAERGTRAIDDQAIGDGGDAQRQIDQTKV